MLVDIPKDVQNQGEDGQRAERAGAAEGHGGSALHAAPPDRLTALAEAAQPHRGGPAAPDHGRPRRRPLRRLRRAAALAERTGIPVITTLLGISGFPESHPLHLGMPGMHGEVHVNRAIQQADLIIGLGLRFDDRVTGNLAGVRPRGQGHPHRAGSLRDREERARRDRRWWATCGRCCCSLLRSVAPRGTARRGVEEIAGFRRRGRRASGADLSPEAILDAIDEATSGRCTIVSDVGQHQMWVAKLFPYQRPNSHITSGGLGTMGFAVPAAMGVALARPDEPVWAISGDGGFQMNMQEIATMVQEGIPVKMAVFNNGYLGMVRQWQQFFHGRRYSATPIWSPDYVKLAEAYGIAGWRVESLRPAGRRRSARRPRSRARRWSSS